jgi:hypothetical protein
MNHVNDILNHLIAIVSSWQGATASIAVVVEFLMRVIPSETPKSIAWGVANALHALGKLAELTAEFMDKILGNRTK